MKLALTVRKTLNQILKKLTYSAGLTVRIVKRLLFAKAKRQGKLSEDDKKLIEENSPDKWCDQGGSLRTLEKILAQKGTKVCKETIRKFIISQSWGKLKKQPRTFMLTAKNKKDRLNFALRLKNLGYLGYLTSETFAKSILFTDEKYFYLNHRPNSQNHRFRGDISKINSQKVPKFDVKVLVCGGFTSLGVTPIKFLEGNVNTDVYLNNILPFYKDQFFRQTTGESILQRSLFETRGSFFMQDGAKPHTSLRSVAYIEQEFPWYFHDWPGNSPDLNPLENLWAIVQEKVDHYPFATNATELKERILQAWSQIEPAHLENLAMAFPKRLNKLFN